MKKITLYKWVNLQHVPGWTSKDGFSTEFCGKYGFVDCDHGTEYLVPEGFRLTECMFGELEWYDSDGRLYWLENHNGMPVLENAYRRVHFNKMEAA